MSVMRSRCVSVPRNTSTAKLGGEPEVTSMAWVSVASHKKKRRCRKPTLSRKLRRVGMGGGLLSSVSWR